MCESRLQTRWHYFVNTDIHITSDTAVTILDQTLEKHWNMHPNTYTECSLQPWGQYTLSIVTKDKEK